MNFSLIAAADEKRGIGKNGRLPWDAALTRDLKFFHDTTLGDGNNAVIMGRTTWETIPENRRPLLGRLNIVLTRNPAYELPPGALRSASLEEALETAKQKKSAAVYVIGGAKVFEEAIAHPDCRTIHLTEVSGDFQCDVFFPAIDPRQFKKTHNGDRQQENGIPFSFTTYQRIE